MKRSSMKIVTVLPLALLLSACGDSDAGQGRSLDNARQVEETRSTSRAATGPAVSAPVPQVSADAPTPPPPSLRIEVNLAERELYVYQNDDRVATHPVAVGSKEWPTPTGEWTIGQVIWNPRWIPPRDESWAENEEVVEPGDPENPLGRAQLVYRAPNSVHGTIEPESLGKAVSHGSIRVSNEVAMALARQVMEAGGTGKGESWYREARAHRTERHEVLIPSPVQISIVAGE